MLNHFDASDYMFIMAPWEPLLQTNNGLSIIKQLALIAFFILEHNIYIYIYDDGVYIYTYLYIYIVYNIYNIIYIIQKRNMLLNSPDLEFFTLI